ncbi:CrtK protein [Afipia carboxidovorans OM5]|uniref:Tryptophan-rich sensory protein n=1 Tax=Afipia carboxidovorans (strain ATCC 49405 / DSM 1227 / KCTC 32145 / OM5) TaxID=504832 RepID=B6JEP3_AFIC5|nr:TspO/MBR family protein [Afipia carboxidovorans]ACI92765.1 CrtK protein [Afipia carboxidovorans OM5]AEI03488.1 tryptophan-rich sensory protein [Afipia carboxidovorans OM4]AEI07065.1 tryptophan-rich sensory protein [Afipia carboxidovorans OM5]
MKIVQQFRTTTRLAACLVLCLGIAAVQGVVTRPEIAGWYAGLVKPSWTPPPFVFPVVWTALYILMGVALWRLWERCEPSTARTRAIALFLLQLVLNAAWSPLFFGAHAIRFALADIIALLVAISFAIAASARVDRLAAWMLVPYVLWVAYAATLNAGIAWMN